MMLFNQTFKLIYNPMTLSNYLLTLISQYNLNYSPIFCLFLPIKIDINVVVKPGV